MSGMKRRGDSILYTAGSAITKGDTVIVGNLVCVAGQDIASGEQGILFCEGVFTGTKASGADISQGQTVIYDVSASNFDDNAATPATGDVVGGAVAMADAGTGTTTFEMKLTPGAGTVT